jgi:hypothetical protein
METRLTTPSNTTSPAAARAITKPLRFLCGGLSSGPRISRRGAVAARRSVAAFGLGHSPNAFAYRFVPACRGCSGSGCASPPSCRAPHWSPPGRQRTPVTSVMGAMTRLPSPARPPGRYVAVERRRRTGVLAKHTTAMAKHTTAMAVASRRADPGGIHSLGATSGWVPGPMQPAARAP